VRETVGASAQTKTALAFCLAIITTAAALGGCGGSGSGSSPTTATTAAAAVAVDQPTAAQAEAICARANREARATAANLPQAFEQASSPEEAITESLVRPGIRILERESKDLAALHPTSESAVFSTFVGLFEPVLVLAYQRLASGEASDANEGRELEGLIATLTIEQDKLAKSAGLANCETDFFQALGTAR
jgi:hypothetical protein